MRQMTDNESALLESLELSTSRLNILRAMVDLFEESDPFAYDSEHLNSQARIEHRHRTVRVLGGISDLMAYYYQDANRVIESHYSGKKGCSESS